MYMSKSSKWKEVFAARADPLAWVAAIVAAIVTENILNELLEHFLGPITPMDAVWWVLWIPAIALGWIVYAVVVMLRRKGQ
jgi:hypothetical protein